MLATVDHVNFAQTISCLKGLEPVAESPHVIHMDFSASGGPVVHQKTNVSTFIVDKPFRQLNEELKSELKPRAYSASSFPSKTPSMTTYGFWVNGGRQSVVVTFNVDRENTTKVTVHEPVDLNLLDRLQVWIDGFGGRRPAKPANHEYIVLAGSAKSSSRK